jgi:CHAT domain-containing protein
MLIFRLLSRSFQTFPMNISILFCATIITAVVSCSTAVIVRAQDIGWPDRTIFSDYQQGVNALIQDLQENKLSSDQGREIRRRIAAQDEKIVAGGLKLSTPATYDAALSIAWARARLRYGDPLTIMDQLSPWLESIRRQPSDGANAGFRTRIAEIFLAADLPWRAQYFISAEGSASRLQRQIETILKILDEDSASINCGGNSRDLCKKLRYLLAVPGYQVGNYWDLAGVREAEKEATFRPEVVNKAGLLTFMASGTSPELRQQRVKAESLPHQSAGPGLITLILNYAEGISKNPSELLRALRGTSWKKFLGDEPKPDQNDAAQIVGVRDTPSYSLIVIKRTAFIDSGYLVLRVAKAKAREVSFFYADGAGSMSHAFLRPDAWDREALIISGSFTTSHYQSIWIIDYGSDRIIPLHAVKDKDGGYEDDGGVYHGAYGFVDFDFDGNPELLVNYATASRRYAGCNQCPSRRRAEIWKISPALDEMWLVGAHVSWADLAVGTTRTLLGVGNEVALASASSEITAGTRDLPQSTQTGRELQRSAAKIFDSIYTFVQARDYTGAMGLYLALGSAIERRADAATLSEVHERSLVSAAMMMERLGRYADAGKTLARFEATKTDTAKGIQRYADKILFDVARATGQLNEQYALIGKLKTEGTADSEVFEKDLRYLNEVGNFDEAISVARRAQGDLAFESSANRFGVGWQRAVALTKNQQYDEAIDQLLVLARSATNTSDPDDLSKLYLLGAEIATNIGEFELSRLLVDESVAHMPANFWATEAPFIFSYVAKGLVVRGELASAEMLLRTAIAGARQQRGVRLSLPLHQMADIAVRRGDTKSAGQASFDSLQALIAEQVDVSPEGHKLTFVASADELARAQVRRLIALNSAPSDIFTAIEAWRAQVLRSQIGAAISGPKVPSDPQEMLGKLPSNVALVSYFIDGEESVALVARAQNLTVHRIRLNKSELATIRGRLRQRLDPKHPTFGRFIRDDRVPPDLEADLEALHRLLISPLDIGGIEKLILVPDNLLYWVPWAALLNAEGNAGQPLLPLISKFNIELTPSALLIEREASPPIRSAILLGSSLGVPDKSVRQALPYLGTRGTDLSLEPLPSTRDEIQAAREEFARSNISTNVMFVDAEQQAEAVPSFVQSFAGKNLVHIAGHGLFDAGDSMASALMLGGANMKGVIRASDFAKLDLTAAQLVALSGCQTGAVIVQPGQEAMGFVRGVLASGARRVLVTQWNVDDESTAQWFAAIYKRLAQGIAVDQAYRETMIQMSHTHKHPFFWAAMMIYRR